MSHIMEYGSTERVFSLQACFSSGSVIWDLAVRCAAHINYSVKAPLRGTNSNPGLFVTMQGHNREMFFLCESPSKVNFMDLMWE